MPKDTFFNLDEEKREMIIDIALEEFALHDYKSASLTRVVNKAGIAKGSMYQYFKNKKDLYTYLVNLSANKKLKYIERNTKTDGRDFFKVLKDIHLVGLEFDLNNTKYTKLIINMMNEIDNMVVGEELLQTLKRSDDFMKNYLKASQAKGQLRKDIDTDLLNFVVSRLSYSISDYLGMKYDFSYHEIIKKGKQSIPIDMQLIEEELDNFIEVLKNGMKI